MNARTEDDSSRRESHGVEIFNTCLGCGSPGTQSLRKGGEYQLKVGNATDPGTGVYRMQLTNVAGAGGG